ncbi:hypothetical protein V6N13_149136 [Hibiscus sabdariffa]
MLWYFALRSWGICHFEGNNMVLEYMSPLMSIMIICSLIFTVDFEGPIGSHMYNTLPTVTSMDEDVNGDDDSEEQSQQN